MHMESGRARERGRETERVKVERRKERISGTLTLFCIIYVQAYTCRHPGV